MRRSVFLYSDRGLVLGKIHFGLRWWRVTGSLLNTELSLLDIDFPFDQIMLNSGILVGIGKLYVYTNRQVNV